MKRNSRLSILFLGITYLLIFICWMFYRYYTHNTNIVDDLVAKPIVWITPVIFICFWKKIKLKELGFRKLSTRLVLFSILVGIGLTSLQFFPLYFKFHRIPSIPPDFIILTIATIGTAISEEILFRGFFFKQLRKHYSAIISTIINSIFFAFLHLPILLFVQNTTGVDLIISLYVIFASSIMFCFIYWYSKNLWSPIVAHFVLDVLLLIF